MKRLVFALMRVLAFALVGQSKAEPSLGKGLPDKISVKNHMSYKIDARVLVRLDHVAGVIVDANHSIM
jgi:hypothetical protein